MCKTPDEGRLGQFRVRNEELRSMSSTDCLEECRANQLKQDTPDIPAPAFEGRVSELECWNHTI